MEHSPRPASPRLAALYDMLCHGHAQALSAFWHTVTTEGTPLLEYLDGDHDGVLITLLYRASPSVSHVVVIDGCVGAPDLDSPERRMTRLLETDLWYKSYRARRDLRTVYCLSPDDTLVRERDVTDWPRRMATWGPDPFNPRTFDDGSFVYSLLELPEAPAQPWITPQTGVPTGQMREVILHSDLLDSDRPAWIYTPPGYTTVGPAYGLLLLLDAWAYRRVIPTPTILDNLCAAGRLPPLVCVLLDAAADRRQDEFGCSAAFCGFLTEEAMPWLRQRYHLSHDPAQHVVGGLSLGGLAAAFAGLQAPEVWGNVLSQSGAFWWKPAGDDEDEWLARYVSQRPRASVRFYLEAGLYERSSPPTDGPNILLANRHLRTVLQARGYAPHYQEFAGGHDLVCWRGSLADGLIALFG